MLCATDPDGRAPFRSACTGDSGGPLVAGSALAGIVSWGLRCGGDHDPTVFTDPAAYRAFLTSAQPALAPVSSDAPAVISGTAKVGATLTCAVAVVDPPAGADLVRVRLLPLQPGARHAPAGRSGDIRRAKAGRWAARLVLGDRLQRPADSRPTKPSAALRIAG